MKILRVIPFLVLSVISLCSAATLTAQRRIFTFDSDLSPQALVSSLQKIEHYKASALIFVLAWFAFGNRRLQMAFWVTMVVSLGWELLEATAVGRTARMSDLAPDILGAFTSLIVAVVVSTVFTSDNKSLGSGSIWNFDA
jgi:VanZ family protein